MPYSIWLTSHPRYEDVLAGAPDRLTLEDLRATLERMGQTRPTRHVQRPDGSTWVYRAEEPPALAPLLWAGLRPNNGPSQGTLQLSVSATHPHFLANFLELLTLAVDVCEHRGLRAYEEVNGQALTVESLPRFTDVNGDYARHVAREWQRRRELLHTTLQMPLEFPVGQKDAGPNLLALRLEHPKLPALETLLADPPPGQGVEVRGTQGMWFDLASKAPVTWFLVDPHAPHQLLIWPQWGQEPFARTADTTFAAAVRLRARAGGQVLWNGEPVTPERTVWLQRYPELLGVELLQLVAIGWAPSSVSRG